MNNLVFFRGGELQKTLVYTQQTPTNIEINGK